MGGLKSVIISPALALPFDDSAARGYTLDESSLARIEVNAVSDSVRTSGLNAWAWAKFTAAVESRFVLRTRREVTLHKVRCSVSLLLSIP